MSNIFSDGIDALFEGPELAQDAQLFMDDAPVPSTVRLIFANPDAVGIGGEVGRTARTRLADIRAVGLPKGPKKGDVIYIGARQHEIVAVAMVDPDRLLYRLELVPGGGPQGGCN